MSVRLTAVTVVGLMACSLSAIDTADAQTAIGAVPATYVAAVPATHMTAVPATHMTAVPATHMTSSPDQLV